MVLGPVMLELGLHPLVTASTSLLLVGASSSSASVEFALAGEESPALLWKLSDAWL